MECVLLGTGGMMPMNYRFLTSLVVRHNGFNYLFDGGEGTQISIKATKVGIKALRLIAVTHLHADHCLGIPGILMLRAQVEQPDSLTIIGPPKTEDFIRQTRQILDFNINYDIHFIEGTPEQPEIAYENESLKIIWAPVKHSTFCLGYRLEEKERPGKFKPDVAQALGIPAGPLYSQLQQGQSITLPGGREIRPEQVMGNPRQGRRIAFVVDTEPTKNIYRLCDQVDIAFIEGMYLPDLADEAKAKQHMTIDDAARIAARAQVNRAVLVHISPRYKARELVELEEVAKNRFDRAEMGVDFGRYFVPLPD